MYTEASGYRLDKRDRNTFTCTSSPPNGSFNPNPNLTPLAGRTPPQSLLRTTPVTSSKQLEWDKYYMRAVVQDNERWHIGWRLEDLARQVASQRSRMTVLLEALEQLPPAPPQGTFAPVTGQLKGRVAGPGKGDKAGGQRTKVEGEEKGEVLPNVLLATVLAEEEDLNRVVSVECATRTRRYLQVSNDELDLGCWCQRF